MKKNDILLIAGTALFSFLFYQEGSGINVFIFSLIMPILLAMSKPESIKNRVWILAAFLTVLTGFSVFANSTVLSIFAFYIAVSYLAGVTASANASPFPSVSYSTFSYLTSLGFMISDSVDRRKAREERTKMKINWNAIIFMGIFIAVVVLMFFFLYQRANPLFKEITKFINLDFISTQWVLFTSMGFLLIYGAIYSRISSRWHNYELLSPSAIDKEKVDAAPNKFLWFNMDEHLERKSGVVLFALLNFMLLTINVLDISFLWTGMKLPEGFTFAGYLHQGIYTLIFSCVLAFLLILLMFRGKLNFIENNKPLKLLAYIWIIQNIFIAASCAMKNYIYISTYALTYRRILIYVLLIIVIIALITALMKIRRFRNIYYLFRINSFAMLFVFIGVSLFNWDGIITKYNLKNSQYPDISYLADLNNSGLPYLLLYADTTAAGDMLTISNHKHRSFFTPESYLWQQPALTDLIYDKTYKLLEDHKNRGWKSYNLSDAMTIRKIRKLYQEGKLKQFKARGKTGFDIQIISEFTGLQELSIESSTFLGKDGISSLHPFVSLRSLTLKEMSISEIESLPLFDNLETINLRSNNITSLNHLVHYKNLKHINASANPISDADFLEYLPNIEHLDLSGTEVQDLSILGDLKNLKVLHLRNLKSAGFSTLPTCPSLEQIDLSDNFALSTAGSITQLISEAKNLKRVVLKSTGISSLSYFSDTIIIMNRIAVSNNKTINEEVLNKIEYLDVSNNSLTNLNGIQIFKGLKVFYASGNSIKNIKHLKLNPHLIELDLSNNPISSLAGVKHLSKLKQLHFSQFSFQNIDDLSGLHELEALTLSSGSLENTNSLRTLKKLKYLDLSSTYIPSLDFVKDMTSLEFLNLSYYQFDDLEKLLQCPSLKVIVVPRIPIKLKRKLEQEIPQIKIIRDWDFEDQEFYKIKYGQTHGTFAEIS